MGSGLIREKAHVPYVNFFFLGFNLASFQGRQTSGCTWLHRRDFLEELLFVFAVFACTG